MKIIFISHDSNMWGANKSLINMVNGLKNHHYIKPLVLVPSLGPMISALQENDIPYLVIPFHPSSIRLDFTPKGFMKFIVKGLIQLYKNKRALRKLESLLKDEKIDIIHTNSGINTIGFKLSQKLGCEHIWHLREFGTKDFQLYYFGFPFILNECFKQSSGTIAITPSIANYFNLSNSVTLFDAVHNRNQITKPLKEKENFFMFCGALTRSKGLEMAIKAFAAFREKRASDNYQLIILGEFIEPSFENKIHNLIQSYDLKDSIIFKGYVKNTKDYFLKSSGLLMCSEHEGMGRVTVEAMFYGCPVFGYNNGGTKDLLREEKNGYLFDSLDVLVSKISFSLDNRVTTWSKIKAAHKFALENFMEEEYSNEIMKLYKRSKE